MGLGLQLRLIDTPRGFLKRRRAPSVLIPAFVQAMKEAAAKVDPLLGQLFHTDEFSRGLELTLIPGLEPLHFSGNEGAPTVEAATQGGGPGYHAYVVGLLEAASAATGVQLGADDPGAAEPEYFDESGYLVGKDFDALERNLAGWIHGVAKVLAEHADAQEIALMWPIDRPRVMGHPIVTPMGPLPRDAFEEAAKSLEGAQAFGPRFLPWWRQGFTGEVARNLALQLGWSEVRWRVPQNDDERRTLENFVAAADRAQALDPSVALPSAEVAEARALLTADEGEAVAPAASGIGYFRGRVRALGTGGWTFEVPGYWSEEWEDDGSTCSWFFGGITVRQSSFTVEGKLPALEQPEASPERIALVEFKGEHAQGWAETAPQNDEAEPYLQLVGKVAAGNHQCLLTVSFTDAGDQPLAEKIFQSLRPPAPSEPEPQAPNS